MMDTGDLEGVAMLAFRAAGGDDNDPPALQQITKALGLRVLTGPTKLLSGDACYARVNGEERIYRRARLSPVRARFATAAEVGEVLLRREGYRGADIEDCSNYIGAAIVCPRRMFARAAGYGLNLTELAAEFGATQTLVALRRAELLAEPRAVVTPARVYVRWAGASLTDSQWRAEGRRGRPGIRKVALTDDRGRFALEPGLAAEA